MDHTHTQTPHTHIHIHMHNTPVTVDRVCVAHGLDTHHMQQIQENTRYDDKQRKQHTKNRQALQTKRIKEIILVQ